MKNIATRFSQALSCQALVPDLYHGKVTDKEDEASHLMSSLDWNNAIADVEASISYVKSKGAEKVSIMGFCMGGALTLAACDKLKDLVDSGICFYGVPPASFCNLENIKCPIQCHFGKLDDAVGFSDPETAEKLSLILSRNVEEFELHMYDAKHAFMNEVSPKFDKNASTLAFQRSVEFLKRQWSH